MNGFAALDIPPCRRYVVVKATAGFAVCRLILKLLLFYSCLDFTQNLGNTQKIILFPISLFVAFLALIARWLLTLSSYVVAPLMLYIFGCGIYTAYRQTWNQFFILLVAEFICFILFFGATAITEGIGRFSEWLAEL